MKDAKGHGSDKRGGSLYTAATNAVASHQKGVQQATQRTAEEHVAAGGKIPTERQYADLQRRNAASLHAWGPSPTTEFGQQAVRRLTAELEQSRGNYRKFGSEEKPSALTLKLRGK